MAKNQNYVSGDGTLTLEELKSCIKLANVNKNYNSTILEIKNVEHVNILKDKSLLNYIENHINIINSINSINP